MQLASNDKTVGKLKFPVFSESPGEGAWRVSQVSTDEDEKRLKEAGKRGEKR